MPELTTPVCMAAGRYQWTDGLRNQSLASCSTDGDRSTDRSS